MSGVVKPSGRMVPFNPAPSPEEITAVEADGSQVSVSDAISVDGRPAWEVLVSRKDPALLTLIATVDVGGGAGFWVTFWANGADNADLLRDIVASIRIDEAQLKMTLAEASSA